jgi:hypothetical protein
MRELLDDRFLNSGPKSMIISSVVPWARTVPPRLKDQKKVPVTVKQLLIVWLVVMAPAAAGAQPATRDSAIPRTTWGDPDLQGVWDYWTFTPLERPSEFAGKAVLTDEEAAQLARRLREEALGGDAKGPRAGDTGAYSQEAWTDRAKARALKQTSLIVDPPDGKIPSLTADALKREEAHRAAGGHPVRIRTGGVGADGPEDRGLAERCILGFSTGPPMLPGGYNNNVQLFQTPEYVAMLLEMNHDVRIVPLDGRSHVPGSIPQWMGDSRGRWEANTLIVETTNFTDKTASFSGRRGAGGFELGSAEHLRLIERFTRVDAETLLYEFTVEDPATFTRPFTGRFPMNLSKEPIYEYACHEGNYGLPNTLRGGRAEDRKAAEGR